MVNGVHGVNLQIAQDHVKEAQEIEHEFVLEHSLEENHVWEMLLITKNVTLIPAQVRISYMTFFLFYHSHL